jgi:hypothetical protein
MRRILLLIMLLALVACSSTLELRLPANMPARVVSASTDRQLQPSGETYRQLQHWLAANQSGWSQLYATNPVGGIFVSCGDWRLQFVGQSVYVYVATRQTMFSKSVKESEYAFLTDGNGG